MLRLRSTGGITGRRRLLANSGVVTPFLTLSGGLEFSRRVVAVFGPSQRRGVLEDAAHISPKRAVQARRGRSLSGWTRTKNRESTFSRRNSRSQPSRGAACRESARSVRTNVKRDLGPLLVFAVGAGLVNQLAFGGTSISDKRERPGNGHPFVSRKSSSALVGTCWVSRAAWARGDLSRESVGWEFLRLAIPPRRSARGEHRVLTSTVRSDLDGKAKTTPDAFVVPWTACRSPDDARQAAVRNPERRGGLERTGDDSPAPP